MSGLDRFLCSADWEDFYPHFTQEALPKITLDHWPNLLNMSKVSYSLNPFRFEKMWVVHP